MAKKIFFCEPLIKRRKAIVLSLENVFIYTYISLQIMIVLDAIFLQI